MKAYRSVVAWIALIITGTVHAGVVTLMTNDMSTMSAFSSTYVFGEAPQWTASGGNVIFTDTANSSTARARLTSLSSFDFNPDGSAYESVTLEFTTTVSSATQAGYRYQIGLVTTDTVSKYTTHVLTHFKDVEGVVLTNTGDYPLGLHFNPGNGTAPGATAAAAIGMDGVTGTHTYKIVFTATGTELFRNGASLGTTASVLDFSKEYSFVAWGQGFHATSHTRSLDDVALSAIPEPSSLSFLLISTTAVLLVRRHRRS